jgi:hypothetical protein
MIPTISKISLLVKKNPKRDSTHTTYTNFAFFLCDSTAVRHVGRAKAPVSTQISY